uniref:Uncharacterized protein n=1 Tax=Tetranychus urticae TaxID=32264 RepID=T1K7R2_TETUR
MMAPKMVKHHIIIFEYLADGYSDVDLSVGRQEKMKLISFGLKQRLTFAYIA